MEKYRNVFADADGIQPQWVDLLKARIKDKMPLEDNGIAIVVEIISNVWCPRTILMKLDTTIRPYMYNNQTPIRFGATETFTNLPCSMGDAARIQSIIESAGDEEEIDDCCDETGDEDEYLSVSIVRDGAIDIVKIESSDGYGRVAIPFYTKLSNLPDEILPSIVDDRNGKWDWLIHFVPDLMFKTQNPEQYLATNEEDPYENRMKCVIMDEDNGTYVIGIYGISTIVSIAGDEEVEDFTDETLDMINYLVNTEIASGLMSHLSRSLNDPSFFKDEEYVLNHVMNVDDCDDDCDDTEVNSSVELQSQNQTNQGDDLADATKAAIDSMIGIINTPPGYMDGGPHGNAGNYIDTEMDTSVVQVGGDHQVEEEGFSFAPIQKRQRLQY